MPSHLRGPLLGQRRSADGLFEGLPLGIVDAVRTKYKVWLETFPLELADGQLQSMGATVTDVGVVAASAETVTAENGYLLINAGTAADTGTSIQFNAAPVGVAAAAAESNALITPGTITSTATLMDNRELIWAARVGISTADPGFAWDGKAMFGWITTDTTLLTAATGVPAVATGGGAGFHIGEDGVLGYFGQQTAITAAPATARQLVNFNTGGVETTPALSWFEVGFRIKWLDASAGTGEIRYYHNRKYVGSITTDLPMASTQNYSTTFACLNGPVQQSDLAVDYVLTAISNPAFTYIDAGITNQD